jgi:phytoene/squalene synthetase
MTGYELTLGAMDRNDWMGKRTERPTLAVPSNLGEALQLIAFLQNDIEDLRERVAYLERENQRFELEMDRMRREERRYSR